MGNTQEIRKFVNNGSIFQEKIRISRYSWHAEKNTFSLYSADVKARSYLSLDHSWRMEVKPGTLMPTTM